MDKSEVTRIKIGNNRIGIIGLKSVFKEIAENFSMKTDKEAETELMNRLSKANYIPGKVKERYGRAFVREFRKYNGQPFEDEVSGGIEIKVLGQGCNRCDKLEKDVMDILTKLNMPADLEHVRDMKEIASYGVMGVPALIINKKVVCSGQTPSKSSLKKWLEEARDSKAKL
jgi:small redox-active disulfide protein 2